MQEFSERSTGVLTLTHAGVGRSVTVQEGRLVFAVRPGTCSSPPSPYDLGLFAAQCMQAMHRRPRESVRCVRLI